MCGLQVRVRAVLAWGYENSREYIEAVSRSVEDEVNRTGRPSKKIDT